MPPFHYCPICATPFEEKLVSGTQRPSCPGCGFVLFTDPKVVTVVVLSHKERLLLGKRAINPGMGEWSFFGGYVDRGEVVETSAKREVKEETNLDIEISGLIGVYSTQGNPHILLAYYAKIEDDQIQQLQRQPEEVSELAFFTLDQLPALAFPLDYEILAQWQSSRDKQK